MYKDNDKQREANRQASQRRRDKAKGMTNQGVTVSGSGTCVIPKRGKAIDKIRDIPKSGRIMNIWHNDVLEEKMNLPSPARTNRGKDITCFADLPPDVQATIIIQSDTNEEQAKRTAVAVRYQHLFPDRYYSTGVQ